MLCCDRCLYRIPPPDSKGLGSFFRLTNLLQIALSLLYINRRLGTPERCPVQVLGKESIQLRLNPALTPPGMHGKQAMCIGGAHQMQVYLYFGNQAAKCVK